VEKERIMNEKRKKEEKERESDKGLNKN
jgi:hypothetical protein